MDAKTTVIAEASSIVNPLRGEGNKTQLYTVTPVVQPIMTMHAAERGWCTYSMPVWRSGNILTGMQKVHKEMKVVQ